MRKLMATALISMFCFSALPAHAGNYVLAGGPGHHQAHDKKYTVENRVKVYRNMPSPQQQAATQHRRQQLIHADDMRQLHKMKSKIRHAQKQAKKAHKKGYKQGYHDGFHAGQIRCEQCSRRRIRLRQRIRTRPAVAPITLTRRNLQ
jgi:membrane carboxypeptidase/penicillin-binding protein